MPKRPAESELQNGAFSAFSPFISIWKCCVGPSPPLPPPQISAEGLCAADFSFPSWKNGVKSAAFVLGLVVLQVGTVWVGNGERELGNVGGGNGGYGVWGVMGNSGE